MRTRVGYAGGTTDRPTYQRIGDHSETIQIEYDASVITYEELLDVFWDSHSPDYPSYSTQYASKIMYHNEQQREAAEKSIKRRTEETGRQVYTELVPFERFYMAEDYHQKYYLQNENDLLAELKAIYPDHNDFVNSTAVARVNGYLGRYANADQVREALPGLGLSAKAGERLLKYVAR